MTSVWVGERFGLVLVQAGVLSKVLTFGEQGMLGSYNMPLELGTVTDAQCVISDGLAWLKVTSRAKNGAVIHRCYAFDPYARLRATASARQGQLAWLDQFDSSALPVRDKLIVPVRRTGIVQVGLYGNELRQETVLNGTEPLTQDVTVGLCLANDNDVLHASRNTITRVSTR